MRAARDRLFVLEAGLTQVNVDIDEARRRDEAFGFDHFSVVTLNTAESRAHGFDDSVAEDEVRDLVEILAGVDDTSAANDEPAHARSSSLSCPPCPPVSR